MIPDTSPRSLPNESHGSLGCVVVKLGGATLFERDMRWEALLACLYPRQSERVYVVVGGGETVESMRTLHEIYPSLDPIAMHWRCVGLMDATWQIACELSPCAHPIADWEELQRSLKTSASGLHFVRVGAFYAEHLCDRIPQAWLPRMGWEATSDALSWLLAKLISATQLRLAKRCEIDPAWSLHHAAERGIVDSDLARLVAADPQRESLVIEYFRPP